MTSIIQVIVDGLSIGSTYSLLALGLSLVFGVMGLINFAYGSMIVWGGYTIVLLNSWGSPYFLSVAAMIIVTTLISLAMGGIAFRPFLNAPPATLLLTSFGVTLVSQAILIFFFGEGPKPVVSPPILMESLKIGEIYVSILQIVAVGICIIILLALQFLINHTSFGMEIRASAENCETARLMGVKAQRVILLVFILSGLIAAVVAFVWFARVGTVDPRADLTPTLKAFIAVVLGGIGTVRGAIIGGFLLGLIESSLATYLGIDLLSYQQAMAFGLVIIFLIMRPEGIAGRQIEVSK